MTTSFSMNEIVQAVPIGFGWEKLSDCKFSDHVGNYHVRPYFDLAAFKSRYDLGVFSDRVVRLVIAQCHFKNIELSGVNHFRALCEMMNMFQRA